MRYLEGYNAALGDPQPKVNPSVALQSWSPPPPNSYKVSVDGATFLAQRAVGVGVVVRDELGRVVAALSKRINAPLGAVEAEAKAFETGLQYSKDIGVQDIILEGDSVASMGIVRAGTISFIRGFTHLRQAGLVWGVK